MIYNPVVSFDLRCQSSIFVIIIYLILNGHMREGIVQLMYKVTFVLDRFEYDSKGAFIAVV